MVDPRCRGLGVQPLAAKEIIIFENIQSIKNSILLL